jgi:hypothetical protein
VLSADTDTHDLQEQELFDFQMNYNNVDYYSTIAAAKRSPIKQTNADWFLHDLSANEKAVSSFHHYLHSVRCSCAICHPSASAISFWFLQKLYVNSRVANVRVLSGPKFGSPTAVARAERSL